MFPHYLRRETLMIWAGWILFLGGLAGTIIYYYYHPPQTTRFMATAPMLSLSRSLSTIPVYLPSGQETVLNADTNPIVATTYQNTPFLKRLAVTYDQVSAPKRPIMILITDPGTDKIHQAVQRVVQAMARANATVPWALQIGPRNLYVGAQPTLLTDGAAGTAHRIVGSQAIVQALPQVAALPQPPRVHAHSSSQGQKTPKKG